MEHSEHDEVEPLPKVEAVFKTKKGRGWDEWEVLKFEVNERLSSPYLGVVDVIAPSKEASFNEVLGKSCALVISRGPNHRRYFKGIAYRVEQRMYPAGLVARISFAAAIFALQHGKDSRVFENRTAPEIIEEVVKEALEPFDRGIRLKLTRSYPKREYCTQYQESDWDFIQRLMADEGIFFYFEDGETENDTETVVLVDSNESCPWIETMEPVKAIKAAPRPVQASTWVEVQVVWDESSDPVSDLPIVIEPPGGARAMRTTSSDGRARLDPVDPGTCEARCSFAGLKYSECVEFAGMGESPVAREPGTGASPRNGDRPQAIVQVSQRKVRSGDTLESIAKEAGLKWQDLAYFNWGTKEPVKINEHLFGDVGCATMSADGKNYIFTDSDSPGLILVPRQWRQPGLATTRRHIARVRPIRRTSLLRFSLDIDPKRATALRQRFRLFTEGGDFEQLRTAADDLIQGDDRIDLKFTGCPVHGIYSLELLQEGSDPVRLFDSLSFEELHHEFDAEARE
jgi:hypothetical protein